MRPWAKGLIMTGLLMGGLAVPAMAFVHRTGKVVVVSEVLQDDLYLAGGTVTASAMVDGDVVASGGTIDLNGDVSGGVLAAGGTLTVGGAIGRTLRAAAGTLTVDSRIKGDVVVAGGTVNMGSAAQIGRDLVAEGGSVTLAGTVGRNALIGGGNVVIGGAIHGNSEIQANRIVLLPTARIGGVLRYSAKQPIEIQQGAQIVGGTTQMPARVRPPWALGRTFNALVPFSRAAAEALVMVVLGAVVFAIAPWRAPAVVREIQERFGRSLMIGFVLLVTVPAAAVLLLFTVVGIPLSVIGILLYFATLYPGQVFVAAWVGHRILGWVRRRREVTPSAYWSLVLGAIVLALLFAIPYVGWAIRLMAMLSGFGALWLTLWAALSARPVTAQAQSTPPP